MPEERMSCPSCGNAILPSDAFCSSCGVSVRARGLDAGAERRTLVRDVLPTGERRHCASCNAPLFPGDSYCAACGSTQSPEGGAGGPAESVTRFRARVEEASRGRYRIHREIGRGGMGAVFLADDTEFDRKVAIKILSGGTSDPATLRRFEREARTVAQLRHDAIVRVHDVGGMGDLHYFVMDYVQGVSLQRLLQAQGPLPVAMVEAVLYRVGVGLAHAHAQANPVVHRDVKPSNILVDTEGQVTIMDFGVAKVGQESAGLTRTGMIVGTPEYISPEQVRSAPVSPATDQYALGAVAFAMLTGRPPFAGSFYEVLIAHQKDPVPDLREARPDVPEALASAVERMLEKDPGDRWPGIPAILRELELRPLSPYDPTAMEMARIARDLFDRGGGDGASDGPVGVRTSGDHLRITLPQDTIEVGESLTLDVGLETGDGRLEPVDGVTWSADPPHVVRIDGDTGELVAVAAGAARLTARTVGADGSVDITVARPEVVRVALAPDNLSLRTGVKARLEARTLSRSGRPLDHPRTWASSDPSVVAVTPEGEVTGLREGSASVVLYCDSAWAAVAVHVEAAVAAPENPTAEAAPVDEAAAPGASPEPAQGEAGPAPGPTTPGGSTPRAATPAKGAAPSSSPSSRRAPSSAPPGAAGAKPAARAGASAPPSAGDSARGVVTRPRHRQKSTGGPGALPLVAGGALIVVLGGGWWLMSRGSAEMSTDLPAERGAAGAPAVAGADDGPPPPAATASDPETEPPPGSAGSAPGAPVPAPVASALQVRGGDGRPVDADPLVLTAGAGVRLDAVLVDSLGDPVDGSPPSWRSEDPAVAVVEEGRLQARSTGTTRVRAQAGGLEATLLVRVQPAAAPQPEWSALQLRDADGTRTVAGPLVLQAGESERVQGVLVDARGRAVDGPSPRWSSDDPGVARVVSGTVRATGEGTTRVRARVDDVEATLTVIVRAVAPEPQDDDEAPPPRDGALIIQLTGGLWSNVLVDGRILGEYQTTYELSPLSAGPHRVRLEGNPAAEPVDTTIIIPPGETVTWQRRLGGGSHP